jgi:hypothetical protein
MTTKVKFLYHEKNNDLFAYFPYEEWCNGTMSCYTPMEGHSACHPLYTLECREATYIEARDLKIELLQMGYKINILNKWDEKKSTELEEQINEAFWAIK